MDTELSRSFTSAIDHAAETYILCLVAAEAAVLRGQFNVAKVLRATAHSNRVMAMQAARGLADKLDFSDASGLMYDTLMKLDLPTAAPDGTAKASVEQSENVKRNLTEILRRALASLEVNSDVLESDVHQVLWGCYGCGAIVEGDLPDACPVCGGPSVEFEWFGPFYSTTPEHLGQLSPTQILQILELIPDQVAEAIAGVTDETLTRKPSADEWCIKEIIGHMLETDVLCCQRIKVLLESEGIPALPRVKPPWKLHEGKGYEAMPTPELLDRFRQERTASLQLMRGLRPQDWSRVGTVTGHSTSMLDLGTWLANHDRGHLAQIRRLAGKAQ